MWANRAWVGRYLPSRTVPGTERALHDAETVEVEVEVRRIYAMKPVRD